MNASETKLSCSISVVVRRYGTSIEAAWQPFPIDISSFRSASIALPHACRPPPHVYLPKLMRRVAQEIAATVHSAQNSACSYTTRIQSITQGTLTVSKLRSETQPNSTTLDEECSETLGNLPYRGLGEIFFAFMDYIQASPNMAFAISVTSHFFMAEMDLRIR